MKVGKKRSVPSRMRLAYCPTALSSGSTDYEFVIIFVYFFEKKLAAYRFSVR
jgi:hypothetical protein